MKFGIVTISFNQAAFLQEAIDSVRLSAKHDLNYIMVDPGSTDGSRDIIARNRSRFGAVILDPDTGPADGLNHGFAACDGGIVGYLNADDRFVPGALDFVASYFEQNKDIDLLLGAIRIVDGNGKPQRRGRAPDFLDLRRYASSSCFAWQQATFFRHETFLLAGGFNPSNRISWDNELVFDMALAGARIGYTNTILGDFRIYPSSLTGSGKQASSQKRENAGLRQKLIAAGHMPGSPGWEQWQRLKYKYSPLRHLRCLFGIRMPAPPPCP